VCRDSRVLYTRQQGAVVCTGSQNWIVQRRIPTRDKTTHVDSAIFSTREHDTQFRAYYERVRAHLATELEYSKTTLTRANEAMKDRARDYAAVLVGQHYNRSPIIATGANGKKSSLMQMLTVPPILHAIIHQVEANVGYAHILFKVEANDEAYILSNNATLQLAIQQDNKPKATYLARKLSNYLGTVFAGWLYSLPSRDPRRVYANAFTLHALFVRRMYDGQRYSRLSNFCTLVYSTFCTLLFNDLSQRTQQKNTQASVHWAHMYAFAAVEHKHKMSPLHHSERRLKPLSFNKA
jgi:hypothetical protein